MFPSGPVGVNLGDGTGVCLGGGAGVVLRGALETLMEGFLSVWWFQGCPRVCLMVLVCWLHVSCSWVRFVTHRLVYDLKHFLVFQMEIILEVG